MFNMKEKLSFEKAQLGCCGVHVLFLVHLKDVVKERILQCYCVHVSGVLDDDVDV